jgi:hypothetical protein
MLGHPVHISWCICSTIPSIVSILPFHRVIAWLAFYWTLILQSLHVLSVTLLHQQYPKLHNSDCVISMGPTFLEYVLVIICPVESDVAWMFAVTDGWLCMRTECLWYMVDLFKGAF